MSDNLLTEPFLVSFPPIIDKACRTLILGSMPGQASLCANQYYAHPRNLFWTIMGKLCGFRAEDSYSTRTDSLLRCNIALWDVVASCQRRGSLDSAIKNSTIQINDFEALFSNYPTITTVCFNGSLAAKLFRKHVSFLPHITHIDQIQLPSTSPANASQSFAYKLQLWKQAISVKPL